MSTSSSNYSVFSIPIAWLVALIPHRYGKSLAKVFDPKSPRSYAQAIENDKRIDNATRAQMIRCEGAHANGIESLGFFATSVLAGNLAGLPAQTLNALSAGYVVSRVLYNFIYINNTTAKMPAMRSLVFMIGIGLIITLYVKSGIAVKDGPIL